MYSELIHLKTSSCNSPGRETFISYGYEVLLFLMLENLNLI